MASLNLVLSSKVWTNCLEECMVYTLEIRVSFPTKIWAMVTPESMGGVSEKMVSVATASFLPGMLNAGNPPKCFDHDANLNGHD